jgi:hypothetical protein
MPDVMWVQYVPLDGFLVWLVAGWRLPFIVEPCGGHHRHYSILLTREHEPTWT